MAGVPVEAVHIRALTTADADWALATLTEQWGGPEVARKGALIDASTLPGLVAVRAGSRVGLATSAERGGDYEVVTISSSVRRQGVGRLLMQACFAQAREHGCRRVWLVTTNDNVAAIAFYQPVGMELCALHRDGVARSRAVKPTIPLRDAAGVPIRHELEFELLLGV